MSRQKQISNVPKQSDFNVYQVSGTGVRKQFINPEEATKFFDQMERKLKKREERFTLRLRAADGRETPRQWYLIREASYSDDYFEE